MSWTLVYSSIEYVVLIIIIVVSLRIYRNENFVLILGLKVSFIQYMILVTVTEANWLIQSDKIFAVQINKKK